MRTRRSSRWGVAAMAALVLGAGAGVPNARAQLDVSMEVDHYRLLLYEPVWVTVTIANKTAGPLHLDHEDIGFIIEQRPGKLMQPTRGRWPFETLEVPARKAVEQRLNLLDVYDLRTTGPFMIEAYVEQGDRRINSTRAYIHIVPGLEVETLEYGPAVNAAGSRTFELLSLNRSQKERLFLRIMDPTRGLCFGAFELGSYVRLEDPEISVDAGEKLHVLHQAGPDRHLHHVFSFTGTLVNRKSYSSTLGEVSLSEQDDGSLNVVQRPEETETSRRQPERVETILPPEKD